MDQLVKKLTGRWSMSHRIVARFKAPRGGFSSPEVEAAVRTWTEAAEKNGHDFKDWKLALKSRPDMGWETRCRFCNADMRVEPKRPSSGVLDEAAGVFLTGFRIDEPCEQEKQDIVRGLFVETAQRDEILSKSPAQTAKELLSLMTHERDLGEHWTNPDNVEVARSFSVSGRQGKVGVSVVLHGEFWKSDQRRNLGNKRRLWQLVEFTHEEETFFGHHEVIRLNTIEWLDADNKWVSVSMNGAKVRT